MRRYAFIITLIGITSLLLILILQKPLSISSPEQLSQLKENQKVLLSNQVLQEKISSNSKTLLLKNNISLVCDISCPSYLNKNITALGIIDNYNDKTQIKILKIS